MSSVEIQMESELLNATEKVPRGPSPCWRWLSVCSFLLLAGATVFLALLYFKVIPFKTDEEEFKMPEMLAVHSYLDSVPPEVRGQLKAGKKLAAHCPGQLENGQLKWEKSTLMEEEEVKLVDNSLVIPREGLYFVYTQVAFTGVNCRHGEPLYLSHTVKRWSESLDDELTILSSTKSVCEVPSTSAWFQPMYEGGLFHLEAGDVLSTHTTNLGHLYDNPTQVYFGVLAI